MLVTPIVSTHNRAAAFVDIADAYRWLAAATCTLDDLQRGGFTPAELGTVRRLVPNSHVAFQASALVYGRGLILFYGPAGKKPTDINARDFGIRVGKRDPDLRWLLKTVLPSIDKHLAHLTEFRDDQHPERGENDRLEWTSEIPRIADALARILDTVAKSSIEDAPKFALLHDAVVHRRADRSYRWPAELDPGVLNPKG